MLTFTLTPLTALSLLLKHNFMMFFSSVSLPSPLPLPLYSLHFHLPSPPQLSVVAPVIVDLTANPSTGVTQGSPLNLSCEAVGGPTLNVTWTTPTSLASLGVHLVKLELFYNR